MFTYGDLLTTYSQQLCHSISFGFAAFFSRTIGSTLGKGLQLQHKQILKFITMMEEAVKWFLFLVVVVTATCSASPSPHRQ
jgi:hypothetical protein